MYPICLVMSQKWWAGKLHINRLGGKSPHCVYDVGYKCGLVHIINPDKCMTVCDINIFLC